MRFFNLMLIPCSSASDYDRKFRRRMAIHTVLDTLQLAFMVALCVLFLLKYFSPAVPAASPVAWSQKIGKFVPFINPGASESEAVVHLAGMIRLVTDDQVPENKALRYAGLISQASQRFGINPLEIIAIIMTESNFKEKSINTQTGDYGLGQINWVHWGKPFGLTFQDLLDPSINIFLTCHVYKYFGSDFGRYHRGNGIKSEAYLVNVASILSTLNAYSKLNQMNFS